MERVETEENMCKRDPGTWEEQMLQGPKYLELSDVQNYMSNALKKKFAFGEENELDILFEKGKEVNRK